jgi:Tfp pilus assembly protein PilV
MLVEVLVSAVLLIALALATLKLIDGSQNMSAQDRSKSVAAALAQSSLDEMRQARFTSVTASPTAMDVTRTVASDGRNYSVNAKAVWTSAQGESTSCTTSTGGNAGQYLRLTSTVTWPGMTGAPITADTVLAPRGGEVTVSNGAFLFKFQNVAGTPLQGVSVTLSGQTLVSSTAGCVLFTNIAPGTYTTQYSKYGYVATNSQTIGTYDAVVTKGNTSGKTLSLDLPATITPITFKTDAATPVAASWRSATVIANMGTDYLNVLPQRATTSDSASVDNTAQLFPFSAGYQVYAGRCDGQNPLVYNSGFSASGVFTASAPTPGPGGSVSTATAFLRRITVNVSNVPASARLMLTVKPLTTGPMANCTAVVASETSTSTAAQGLTSGTLAVSDDIPYGLYSLCVSDTSNATRLPVLSASYNNTPTGTTGTYAPTTTVAPGDYRSLSSRNPAC